LGAAAYAADVSETGGFDYLHDPKEPLTRAQQRAASVFGADRSWFLVNGATVGNLAAVLATVHDGEEIIVARGSHRSVYAGIALAGAIPVYLAPVANHDLDGLFGISRADVDRALHDHPGARAVHLTNPSYYGFTIDLGAIAELTRSRGIPLIVDEAHGTHWVFHEALPATALSTGADCVIQSPHKTLGSLTQSSLLHLRGTLVDPTAVDRALQMLQSSSPSALLLISIDAAIEEMAAHGGPTWGRAIELGARARAEIEKIPGLSPVGEWAVGTPGIAGFDPTKVVVDVSALGITGFAAAERLRRGSRISPEFSDLRRMVFSVTSADTDETIDLLTKGLREITTSVDTEPWQHLIVSRWPTVAPEMALSPRLGAALPSQPVPRSRSVGRISGEIVVPYPPGIPLLVPGERISAEVITAIGQLLGAGARIVGVADPTVATLRCVDEPESRDR
jgi:arginine/lysine/ornithine decarboxylase